MLLSMRRRNTQLLQARASARRNKKDKRRVGEHFVVGNGLCRADAHLQWHHMGVAKKLLTGKQGSSTPENVPPSKLASLAQAISLIGVTRSRPIP